MKESANFAGFPEPKITWRGIKENFSLGELTPPSHKGNVPLKSMC